MSKTHGLSGTLTHFRWKSMMQRCYYTGAPSFARYGANGIKVCASWHDYPNFLIDMGECPSPAHTLERRSNEGDYEPSNCKWATRLEQNRNRSQCVKLTFNGQTKIVSEWAELLGISAFTIRSRLRMGWDTERTLSTPPGNQGARK